MNVDQLNRWITLAANVGVLVGIVAIVFELNQTQVSLEGEASIARTDRAIRNFEIWLENDIAELIEKVTSGSQLTKEEKKNADLFYVNFLRYLENNHFQYQQGVLDGEIWEANLRGLLAQCDNPLFITLNDWPEWPLSFTYRDSFVELVRTQCG